MGQVSEAFGKAQHVVYEVEIKQMLSGLTNHIMCTCIFSSLNSPLSQCFEEAIYDFFVYV